MGTMMTLREVAFSSGSKEADLRIFFMCFLIMHLATHFYMDDDLGSTPPKPYAFLWRNSDPQIGVHPIWSD